jgi:hypothetical protein
LATWRTSSSDIIFHLRLSYNGSIAILAHLRRQASDHRPNAAAVGAKGGAVGGLRDRAADKGDHRGDLFGLDKALQKGGGAIRLEELFFYGVLGLAPYVPKELHSNLYLPFSGLEQTPGRPQAAPTP